MTERAIDVLTNTLDANGAPSGDARILASRQLEALHQAGLAVVPAFQLSALWGFLGSVAARARLDDLRYIRNRSEDWRKAIRSWIPDERHEDDE